MTYEELLIKTLNEAINFTKNVSGTLHCMLGMLDMRVRMQAREKQLQKPPNDNKGVILSFFSGERITH